MTSKNVVTLKSGQRSLKVIENDNIPSGTHDFVLTFHSNHRPISYRFRDKRRFQSKSPIFPTPRVFNAPAEGGSPWNWVSAQGVTKANDGATRSKKF